MMHPILRKMERGLIVSCQALKETPLHDPVSMSAMAKSAELSGAIGIRANGVADIRAIKNAVSLPVIGILKRRDLGPTTWITIDLDDALAIASAGAEMIAMDATKRKRPTGQPFRQIAAELKREAPVLVMADISTLEEGLEAAKNGADIIATTLSGYTPYSPQQEAPDLKLVEALASHLDLPVIAEGRFATPQLASEAIEHGAFAVVVGQAITNSIAMTKRFVLALSERLAV